MRSIINKAFKFLLLGCTFVSCTQQSSTTKPVPKMTQSDMNNPNQNTLDTATLAMGCFWCIEAVFQELKGVKSVTVGYIGGKVPNPTYDMVCSGATGHAEAAQIVYDPKIISYDKLLEVFWQVHDPTQLNHQGNDVGTQYRSAIFYHNDYQKQTAEKYKKELDASGSWDKPIVTEIVPATTFYKAEDYHQDYYTNNSHAPYCQYVIRPKLDKFHKVFKDMIDTTAK
jgi:peptide-methionine (S)-S-oxide reductase